MTPPRVLTIAGSDSGGGAGIQADLKTFQEFGVYGMSAITAVTAQNSLGIQAIYTLDENAVQAQLDSVLSDIGADAVKTGMLLSPGNVLAVASAIRQYGIRHVVVDPVLYAKDGSALLRQEAILTLRNELLPIAEVVTPNVPEACELLGWAEDAIRSVEDMIQAARRLLEFGPQYVFLKGGHLASIHGNAKAEDCIDVLVSRASSKNEALLFQAQRILSKHTHGTGCTTASAIAAGLALGISVEEAVEVAKRFVTKAIEASVPVGRGVGSLWHAANRE
ncbi:bifunctional hydroxymethylpyrimidine kinase/phosphomethylpyrimidine kinase [Paenibacillus baekrokdamisoli]|nr:bifunctional hydroxymethylpyrimidine kinase/phosphomethylpyrimidine kinase [Paenibacillus baekrokdamisoli]